MTIASPSPQPETMPPPNSHPQIILCDLPPKTFIGIDLLSFNSSPTFRGISHIPPGSHLLYTGADASLSIRHGHWFLVSPPTGSPTSKLHIWQWNPDLEVLEPVEHDGHAAETSPQDGLIAYHDLADASRKQYETGSTNQEEAEDADQHWPDLTKYVTTSVLDRVLGPSHTLSSTASATSDIEAIPGLSASETNLAYEAERPLNFTPIDLKRTWPPGAVGRERTDAARDTSWYLGHLMDSLSLDGKNREQGAAQVLGELQLCFVAVLTLANWSALQQWKRLLGTLLGCRRAAGEIEGFFVEVVRVLRGQLERCEDVEGGLFEFREEEGGSKWLRGLVGGFKAGVEEGGAGDLEGGLGEEIEKLEQYMRDVYGWEVGGDTTVLRRGMLELEDGERVEMEMDNADEEDETGEYAPVLVDLG